MRKSDCKERQMLRISMIQAPVAWEDREENLRYFGELLSKVYGKVQVAILPETFSTGFTMNVGKVADTMDGPTVSTLKQWAADYDMAIAGSFIVKEGRRYYNRAFFITPEGNAHYYDKRHLFRMGGEDKFFSAGDKRLIIPYKGWNICLMVCYDLRFPVWSRNVDNEYDLLIYVANWPWIRMEAWKTLLKARALENMAYVCGVNRTGYDGNGVFYRGDSILVNPKGVVQADASRESEITRNSIINKVDIKELRAKFPAWKDADTFTITP